MPRFGFYSKTIAREGQEPLPELALLQNAVHAGENAICTEILPKTD